MKRIIAAILAGVMLFSMFACSQTNENDTTDTSATSQNETTVAVDDTSEETETELQPDLPDADFEGDTITFLTRDWGNANHLSTTIRDVYAEGLTGEVINDAVFERNNYVESLYNIKIEQINTTDHYTMLKTSVTANDGAYDVYYAGMGDHINAAKAGLLRNLYSVPHLEFDMPWWDNNASESMSVCGKLFGTDNAIMLANNDSTSAILFNKQLIEDFGLENPYDLVRSLEWDIEKMTEMSSVFSRDINGDSVMDYNDAYGFVCYRDASLSFFHSSGGRIASKDADGNIVITVGEEKSVNALLEGLELIYQDSSYNLHKELESGPLGDQCYAVAENIFMSDHAIFYWILMHDVAKFREMESDFGIIPVPSADPKTTGYGSTVNQYHGCFIGLPTTVDEEEMGVVLEALAAKSYYTVQTAYYDIALSRKYSRDEDSAEMLDIIFSNRIYDIGAIYNIASLSWNIIYMTMTDNTNIASLVEKSLKIAQLQIDRTIVEAYESIDN